MSGTDLETYLERAKATGVEPSTLKLSDLAQTLGGFLKTAGVSKVAVSDFAGHGEIKAAVESGLAAAGCQKLNPADAKEADVGITFCKAYLARTGSQIMTSGGGGESGCSLFPAIHIAISKEEGCHGSLSSYVKTLGGQMDQRLALITGPSRTGDIEASMTTCVHGPGRVAHFIIV